MGQLFKAFTGSEISAAAARGVSHRLKHPYAQKNPARPFAVDTGLYVQSFRAIVREEASGSIAALRYVPMPELHGLT